jgi:hypothetical protein
MPSDEMIFLWLVCCRFVFLWRFILVPILTTSKSGAVFTYRLLILSYYTQARHLMECETYCSEERIFWLQGLFITHLAVLLRRLHFVGQQHTRELSWDMTAAILKTCYCCCSSFIPVSLSLALLVIAQDFSCDLYGHTDRKSVWAADGKCRHECLTFGLYFINCCIACLPSQACA